MAKLIRIKVRLGGDSDDSPPPAEAPPAEWPLRPVNFFVSLLAHAGIAGALAYMPPIPTQAEKAVHAKVYKVIDLKKEPIIYWARVPAALPAVSPETPIGASRAFRGEEQSKTERIVVQQPNADPAKQLVWQPDKPERLRTETPLQNMVAVQGKPVPKPFEPPKARQPEPETPKALPVPETQIAKTELPVKVVGSPALPTAKPQPKTFVPPKTQPKLALAPGAVAEAPPELAASNVKLPGAAIGAGALPKRPAPFVPPPPTKTGPGPGDANGKGLTAPPELPAGGTGSTVTAAVIGLNPATGITALPDGSRPAAFSRARRVGEPSGGTPGQGPVVPGVAIAGNRSAGTSLAPVPTAPAGGPPRSFDLRLPPAASTTSAPLRPSSRTLPRAIEARFSARIVYVLVIPKPNLPHYIADWTMWFSERTSELTASPSMRAPVPIRKTLRPDTPPSAGYGAEGWVQVSAIIGKDGKLSAIAPLPGRTPAVAAKAAEDLINWEFRPASRNGEAIDVEVVIEIPFRVQ
ncbi:MAG: hypothetical protein JNM66_01015 [Bryobacterales bacterium]|nr:hypothetical protein [Bryobacterales bacterium]